MGRAAHLMDSGPNGCCKQPPALTNPQPWLEGHVMAEREPTAPRPFFQPRPERDDLNTAYLLAKVAQKVVVNDRGCWVWTGNCNGNGYGRLEVAGRRPALHRLVYEFCVAD